jgi:hypothetical protein
MTRVVGYGVAKAAVDNLTRWLAVELGRASGRRLRRQRRRARLLRRRAESRAAIPP